MHTRGQTIIISGGSRGLGLHLVRQFLAQDNRVATFARTETTAMQTLADEYRDRFHFEELDAINETGVHAFVAAVYSRWGGKLDSLINNAAIGQDQLLMHMDAKAIHRIVEINAIAPAILTRAAIKRMVLSGGGNICNISSICGSRGYAGLSIYAGTKGFLDAMTRSLAREVGEANIRINCVAPGFFESEMSSVLLPEQLATIKRRTPSGRLATDEDIYRMVDLVVSGASNIQGQVIYVDGGITS